mmetsp:Transcript_20624/g.44891  ORF Transcript_20624/g.44891 Transcript_20624/m.44891 type:complete len:121 (+) Transcript_20624:199-561(+)|eukprot:CAMPEP_0168166190 /NCGR_PEP_ID=MMETSP0139_2-20121125/1889_1 /TAXON_ID=44445 /ORGANISM="Pseudo-nitzschia australis, Strain 10249 10 AB" /LENGTH=120 /DNA_ID=CAMNT_0008083359 /DNA_START=212 /DNA_END=574 /DNA_ORIENTATION=+
MDALSKDKKDQYATAFAILALYDGGAEVTSEQIAALLEATGNKEVEAFYPIIFAQFLNDPKKIGEMIAAPGGGGGGGGGGGAAGGDAAEEVEEEEEEEEEAEAPAGGGGLFGDDGDGGDY